VRVVVLAKDVPNPSGFPPEIGPDFRLRREAAEGGLDPSDEPGIEVGVRAIEEHGGELTAVSVGPEGAIRALWRALALGADNAVLVTDGALDGADALATANVLAAAISRRSFDLVVAGVESSDGATGTMPMTLAELLGVPSLTFARRVTVSPGSVSIERQTATGYDIVECELPALVTVTLAAAEPRYPSLREAIAAKKKPVERLSLEELGVEPADVHVSQTVTAVEIAPQKHAGELVQDPAEAPARIVRVLAEANVV
jgi:electron transfer flavoprotein beta subunit